MIYGAKTQPKKQRNYKTVADSNFGPIMARSDTRLQRLKSRPTDMQWDELVSIMGDFDFAWIQNAGGSSHGNFMNHVTRRKLSIAKPHNPTILKAYQIREVLRFLKEQGYI